MTIYSSLFNPATLAQRLAGNLYSAAQYIAERLWHFKRTFHYSKTAADALAADVTAKDIFNSTAIACGAFRVRILPKGALTSNDSNYANLVLGWDDGAGGAVQVIATVSTKTTGGGGTGNWVAGRAIIWAGTLTNTTIPADAIYSLSIAKVGTGVVVPICLVELTTEGS